MDRRMPSGFNQDIPDEGAGADILVQRLGSLTLINLLSTAAREWWTTHVEVEGLDLIRGLLVKDKDFHALGVEMEEDGLNIAQI
jgi:hypothetical protein